jgi:hypothetical protein
MTDSKANIVFKPLSFDDLTQRKPDIPIAKKSFPMGTKDTIGGRIE